MDATVIIVMGVSGVGKTTVGRLLAEELGWPFYEGDNFHPRSNVSKMRRGIPLTDADRHPWLMRLREVIRHQLAQHRSAVVACSALKKRYRDLLRGDDDAVQFVFLKGHYELIQQRITDRTGHYMPAELLQTQFMALEEPREAIVVDAAHPPEENVQVVRQALIQEQSGDKR